MRYYEVLGGFPDWDANNEFDSADQGLDLLCDIGEFHVTWDNTFWSYGLKTAPGLLIHHVTAAVYSDATTESRWTPFIGQIIQRANVEWEEIPLPKTLGSTESTVRYPQAIEFVFDNDQHVLISAAIWRAETQSFFGMSDHVTVAFDKHIIEKLRSGE